MTYVYEHTESLCESRALHNWFIFSSHAPHQGRSPEVQGLQNSLNTKNMQQKPQPSLCQHFKAQQVKEKHWPRWAFWLILKVSPMREWMNLVLTFNMRFYFFFWELNEQTTLQGQTNVRHKRKSTVRKALLTTMLRSIVSTALSRKIFSPKAAKKQLCEQGKERRKKKEKKQVKSHHPHEHLYIWCWWNESQTTFQSATSQLHDQISL